MSVLFWCFDNYSPFTSRNPSQIVQLIPGLTGAVLHQWNRCSWRGKSVIYAIGQGFPGCADDTFGFWLQCSYCTCKHLKFWKTFGETFKKLSSLISCTTWCIPITRRARFDTGIAHWQWYHWLRGMWRSCLWVCDWLWSGFLSRAWSWSLRRRRRCCGSWRRRRTHSAVRAGPRPPADCSSRSPSSR